MSRPARAAAGLVLLAVAAETLLVGCRPERVDVTLTPRTFKADDYSRILWRWTRSRRLIRSLDTVLGVEATYLSPELMAAYAARYSEHYQLTAGEAAAVRASRLADATARHEFFLAAMTSNPDWNDLDRPASIWRLTLVDDQGTRASPIAVKRVRPSEVHRAYFPYVTPFHQVYQIAFPRTVAGKPFITPATRFLKLVMACPLGSTELVWFVKEPANAR
jgi:hypothetical protein